MSHIVTGIAALAVLIGGGMLADPTLEEDDIGWSCIDNGNRVCGPTNEQGFEAGCYNDQEVLVAPWPCHVVTNANGSSDVYGGAA